MSLSLKEIRIASNFSAQQTKEILERHFASIPFPISFECRELVVHKRSLETAAVVAIASAANAVLVALITGLLQIAREGRSKRITIQGKSGWKLEIPADLPREQKEALLDSIHQTDLEKIDLAL